jgi:hypothetical protein
MLDSKTKLWVILILTLGMLCFVFNWPPTPVEAPLLGEEALRMFPKEPIFSCLGPPGTRKIDRETNRAIDDCDGDGQPDIVQGTNPVILSHNKAISEKRWQEFLEGYAGILPPVRCPDGNEEKPQVEKKDGRLMLNACDNEYLNGIAGIANQVLWYGRDEPEGRRWVQAFRASP